MAVKARPILLLTAALVAFTACGEPDEVLDHILDPHQLQVLRDPKSCAGCHPDHYREWSGSAHAYASTSPIFRAMNERGQRDTGGVLGSRCVDCHAPLAAQLGLTTDGTNLAEVPEWAQGITCYYCHSLIDPTDSRPETVALADDGAFRGPFGDPVENELHGSTYSGFHDRETKESSTLCKMCHSAAWTEWASSLYATGERTGAVLSCGRCHMTGRDGKAATAQEAPVRRVHSHMVPGIDVALIPFPEREAQKAAIQQELDPVIVAELCVNRFPDGSASIQATLENVAAGHNFPSCQTADRRVWAEVIAYDGDGAVVFSRGQVADGEAVLDLAQDDLALFAERLFDAQDKPVTMIWDAVGREFNVLPAPTAASPADPDYVDTHLTSTWMLAAPAPELAVVTLRVRVRPIGLDVLNDLVSSGDLDPTIRDAMPTFDLAGAALEWTYAEGVAACVDQAVSPK